MYQSSESCSMTRSAATHRVSNLALLLKPGELVATPGSSLRCFQKNQGYCAPDDLTIFSGLFLSIYGEQDFLHLFALLLKVVVIIDGCPGLYCRAQQKRYHQAGLMECAGEVTAGGYDQDSCRSDGTKLWSLAKTNPATLLGSTLGLTRGLQSLEETRILPYYRKISCTNIFELVSKCINMFQHSYCGHLSGVHLRQPRWAVSRTSRKFQCRVALRPDRLESHCKWNSGLQPRSAEGATLRWVSRGFW